MAQVTITNLTGNVVLLQELYRDVKPYEVFTVEREEDQLHAMPELQKYWNDGVIQISVVKTAAEDNFITTFLHSVGPAALSPNPPATITKSAAVVGVQNIAAHGDHKHDIATAGAVEITDSTNAEGVSTSLARSDHQHAHGNRAGGTLHALATTVVAGFMDPADKTKINALPTVVADAGTTRLFHEPMITPNAGANPPGQQPVLAVIGSTIVAQYTVNTDSAYRLFKIPGFYVSGAAFHIHWTKQQGTQGNGNEFGHSVRWQISYQVFNSTTSVGDNLNVAPSIINIDDVYDDTGTTTRVVQRSANVSFPGFVAGYYLSVSIMAVTPPGTPLGCDPALIGLDLTYTEYINQ